MTKETMENAIKHAKMKQRSCKAVHAYSSRKTVDMKGSWKGWSGIGKYTLLAEDDSAFEKDARCSGKCQETFQETFLKYG